MLISQTMCHRTEQVIIEWCKISKIWRVDKDFPFEGFQIGFNRFGNARWSVAMLQNHFFVPLLVLCVVLGSITLIEFDTFLQCWFRPGNPSNLAIPKVFGLPSCRWSKSPSLKNQLRHFVSESFLEFLMHCRCRFLRMKEENKHLP